MRIWDCSPHSLSGKHLVAEWLESGQVLSAIKRRAEGSGGGYLHHPETLRFLDQPELIVARRGYLAQEAARRGYNFEHRTDADLLFADHFRLHQRESWSAFRRSLSGDWPLLDGGPWSPWKKRSISYAEYRRECE